MIPVECIARGYLVKIDLLLLNLDRLAVLYLVAGQQSILSVSTSPEATRQTDEVANSHP